METILGRMKMPTIKKETTDQGKQLHAALLVSLNVFQIPKDEAAATLIHIALHLLDEIEVYEIKTGCEDLKATITVESAKRIEESKTVKTKHELGD